MNKGLLLAIFAACAALLCLATPASILSVTATNVLTTWEGDYRCRDIHAVALEGDEAAYLAIYTNTKYSVTGVKATLNGVLIELYKESGSQAERLLTAGEDKCGCAPHILAFGDILPATNRYWTIWRDTAPGAHLYYEQYIFTNSAFQLTDRLAFTGIKPDLSWHRYEGGHYYNTLSLDFSNHNIIWLNTNTLYRLDVYNFNFQGNPFSQAP